MARFVRGWERLDPEMILGTIANDVTLIWGTDEAEVWRSRAEFSLAIEQQVQAFSHPVYRWAAGDPIVVHLAEASLVVGVLSVSFESQGSVHTTEMRSTFVVRGDLREGAIVHAHFSVGADTQAVPY